MQRLPVITIGLVLGLLAGIPGTEQSIHRNAAAAAAAETLRIGLSLQPSNALVMVALDRGFLGDEGLRVSVEKYASGTRALRNGLFAGKVDVTTASDVPVVLSRFERQDFSVVATIFQVDNQNRLIARADMGIRKPADLKGKRIATQRGSAVHFFLHLFLLEHGISEDEIRLSFINAADLPAALARGEIDAFSMREPYIGQARAALGDNAEVFAAPGLYSQSDQIVVTNSLLNARPQAVRKLLRALVRAERYVNENAEGAQQIVARFLGTSPDEISAIWPEFVPRVSLEQSLLLRLEDIGRWAVRRRLANARQMPNFLKLIHFGALQAVKPVSITVVR